MYIITNPAAFLLSGQTVSGAGSNAVDARNAANYAYVQYAAASPSAVVKIEASVDGVGWMTVATYTASPTTGTAQLAGYYPYYRGVLNSAFGGGGSTGSAYLYIAPGGLQ